MPNIISPYKEAEVGQKSRVTGHVRIKKVDREGRTTFESEFDNLILDEFLQNGFAGMPDYSGATQGVLLLVGSGAQTTPAATDTALNNVVDGAYVSLDLYSKNTPFPVVLGAIPADDFAQHTLTAEFDYSQAVGDLTELGIVTRRDFSYLGYNYYELSPAKFALLTRALIKDSAGNPTILSKSNAEKLIIEYELRFYRPTEPVFDVTLNSQSLRFFIPTYTRVDIQSGYDLFDTSLGIHLRGGSGNNDLLGNQNDYVYYRDSHSSNLDDTTGMLWMGMLMSHKASAVNSYDYGVGGFSDTTNNVFTGHIQVSPDTVDRQVSKISPVGAGIFKGTSAAPRIMTAEDETLNNYMTFRPGCIVSLDPVTNAVKPFTLPAGYRLDIAHTFERTR